MGPVMAAIRFPAGMSIGACRATVAACRPRLTAALPAFVLLAVLLGMTACDSDQHGGYPVQAAYTRPGPFCGNPGPVKDGLRGLIYRFFPPPPFGRVGFK